jgi:hypothetical protein
VIRFNWTGSRANARQLISRRWIRPGQSCHISLFVTLTVMPGLEPGIQAREASVWMDGSSPAMTLEGSVILFERRYRSRRLPHRRAFATSAPSANRTAHNCAINHASGQIRGVAAIYNRCRYEPEKKSSRNAPHPTTRKRPRETLQAFAPRTQTFGVSGRRRCLRRVANARKF